MPYYWLFWALVILLSTPLYARAAEAAGGHEPGAIEGILKAAKELDPGSIAILCFTFLLYLLIVKIGGPWARVAMVKAGLTSRGQDRGEDEGGGKPRPNPMQDAIISRIAEGEANLVKRIAEGEAALGADHQKLRQCVNQGFEKMRNYVDEKDNALHSRITGATDRLSRVEGRLDGQRGSGDD